MNKGWTTTEFWKATTALVIFLAAQIGLFDPMAQTELNEAATRIITGVFAAVEGAIYIWGRVRLKPDLMLGNVQILMNSPRTVEEKILALESTVVPSESPEGRSQI